MDDNDIPFLGAGWDFPPKFNEGGKSLEVTKNAQNVHKSIAILLQTGIGERPMLGDFGGSLAPYQFEQVTSRLLNDIKRDVSDAIARHEPRAILDEVEIEPDAQQEGLLLVKLQYTIIGANTRYNMVYPFYLTESQTFT